MMTLLKEVGIIKNRRSFECRCDCGHIGIHSLYGLTSGQTKSCGCLRKKTFLERNTTHGKSRTKLNFVRQSMLQRCYNKKCKAYRWYGAKGIIVCDEWKNDLMSFYNWAMENGYKEGLTLDRIKSTGNYEPSNCRWVAMDIQQRNKSNNVFIEFNGETMCVTDWANRIGIDHETLNKRLKNWTLEKALTTPKQEQHDTSHSRIG